MSWDNTTYYYVPKTYEEIWLKMLQTAYAKELLSSDDKFFDYINNDEDIENNIILDYSVHALILSYVYEDITSAYNAMNILLAKGSDLDRIGSIFLVRRPPEQAVGEVTFSCNAPAEENVTIPDGTLVRKPATEHTDAIVFTTVGQVVLLKGTTSITVQVRCNIGGKIGNVQPNKITEMVNPIIGINNVTNTSGLAGGRDAESDDSYRKRLLLWKYIQRKGTPDAIEDAVKRVGSVEGYNIEPKWDGYGTTRIIIDPPTETVLGQVRDSINGVGYSGGIVKAIDEDILVVPVEEVVINVTLMVNVTLDELTPMTEPDKVVLKTKIEQAIVTYIDGGTNWDGSEQDSLGMGNDFIPFLLSVYLKEQFNEIKTVTVSYPSDPITINSHEKAVSGTVIVTVE